MWRSRRFEILLAAAGVLVALVLAWSGINDWRLPFAAPPTAEPAPEQAAGRMLAADSPVRVRWIGAADALEVTWSAMDHPDLAWYSVDVHGVSPVQTWYNAGYRPGEELVTQTTVYPATETNEYYAQWGRAERVDGGNEVWRICVTGMKPVPADADVDEFAIDGAEICSDLFTLPVTTEVQPPSP